MRLRWLPFFVPILGALVGGIYGGVTWHPTCSPGDLMPMFCSRGDQIALGALTGFFIGAPIGVFVWVVVAVVSLVPEERRGAEEAQPSNKRQAQGPGGEPTA